MRQTRGLFITFEGGEGAGKSTLIQKVFETLNEKGLQVFKTREPGGTHLGEKIRDLLLHQKEARIGATSELLLFLASRAQHIEEVLLPHLQQGDVVLCDRFNESSIAYQGVAQGVGFERAVALCDLTCEGLQPDLTFILDLNPEKGMDRIEKMDKEWDRLENLKLSFHQKVREGYHLLSKKEPGRIYLIDASQSKEKVFSETWDIILKKREILSKN
jgi:dTMP kinase